MRQPSDGPVWPSYSFTVAKDAIIAPDGVNANTISVPGVKKGQIALMSADYPVRTAGLVYGAEVPSDDTVTYTINNTRASQYTFTQDVVFKIEFEPVG